MRGTFPFNQRNGQAANHAAHGHHEHAHEHAHAHNVVDARGSRQGGGDDVALDIGSIAAAGERCIDKVVMVEETEYDDVIECKHSYSQKCHTTYTTDFEPQQEEDCEENFRKNCFIEYKKVAVEETVQKCNTPLTYEETGEGCKKVTQSVCTTRFHEHDVEDDVVECQDVQDEKCEDVTQGYTTEQKCTKWPRRECSARKERVTKYTPETECKPVVLELCGPELQAVSGEEECFDEKQTIVQEVSSFKFGDLAQNNSILLKSLNRFPRRPVTSSPSVSASTLPSLSPSSSPLRSASTSPRRCAPGPGRTPGRSRSPL